MLRTLLAGSVASALVMLTSLPAFSQVVPNPSPAPATRPDLGDNDTVDKGYYPYHYDRERYNHRYYNPYWDYYPDYYKAPTYDAYPDYYGPPPAGAYDDWYETRDDYYGDYIGKRAERYREYFEDAYDLLENSDGVPYDDVDVFHWGPRGLTFEDDPLDSEVPWYYDEGYFDPWGPAGIGHPYRDELEGID